MKQNRYLWVFLTISLLGLLLAGGIFALRGGAEQEMVTAVTNGLPQLSASLVADGFTQPTDITNNGDNRLFIVERAGLIRIIDTDLTVRSEPFLDIRSLVETGHPEQGLLGLAFHPDFPTQPYFYINYTADGSGDTVVARYAITGDTNIADPNSRLELLRISQPADNHNGGDLNFGPDGYLYIAVGDGGSGGDPWDNAQSLDTLLGKILRIDVDQGSPYAIPPDNPFVGTAGARDEIWAYGLRNPWRFSFDRQTGDMFIADVGQNAWEEVNFQPASSSGGENYGWRCYEGFHPYNTSGCQPQGSYVSPFDDYSHDSSSGSDYGRSITGGFVYRGADYPELQGYYLYADFVSGNFWLAQESGGWSSTPVGPISGFSSPSTFGEGCAGELFVAGYNGGIYRLGTPGTAVTLGTDGDTMDQFVYLPFINNGNLVCS